MSLRVDIRKLIAVIPSAASYSSWLSRLSRGSSFRVSWPDQPVAKEKGMEAGSRTQETQAATTASDSQLEDRETKVNAIIVQNPLE